MNIFPLELWSTINSRYILSVFPKETIEQLEKDKARMVIINKMFSNKQLKWVRWKECSSRQGSNLDLLQSGQVP